MNMKATAAIMAMIMVASCIGLSVAEESDAEDKVVQAGVVATSANTAATVTLLVNDYAYISGDYTITWQVANNSTNKNADATSLAGLFTTDTPNVTYNKDGSVVGSSGAESPITAVSELSGVTMSIKKEDSGPYTFSMTPASAGVYYIALKSVISVTVNGVSVDLDTIYYTITLDATSASMEEQQLSSATAMSFTYGVEEEKELSFKTAESGQYQPADVKSLTWYAEGLPRGLAMSADGTVSGMPLEVGVFDDVKIHARNTSGQEYYGTLSITVTASSGSGDVSFTYSVGGAAIQAGGAYIIQQNDTLTLTVNTAGTATLEVTQVKISGEPENLGRVDVNMSDGSDDGEYTGTITPEGTGAYTVSIKFGEAEAQFTLYVFAQPDSDVQAEIIVSADESP